MMKFQENALVNIFASKIWHYKDILAYFQLKDREMVIHKICNSIKLLAKVCMVL